MIAFHSIALLVWVISGFLTVGCMVRDFTAAEEKHTCSIKCEWLLISQLRIDHNQFSFMTLSACFTLESTLLIIMHPFEPDICSILVVSYLTSHGIGKRIEIY